MIKQLVIYVLIVISILSFSFGFSEGMEWYRLASCMIGGLSIGVVVNIKNQHHEN